MPDRNPPPRSMMWLALAIALVIAILVFASGCAAPVKHLAFQGFSVKPPKNGLIVEMDIAFTKGTTQEGAQYPFDTTTSGDFIRFQDAQVGTIASFSLKIHGVERGQEVACLVTLNGLVIAQDKAVAPKVAVCTGGPL